MRKKKCSTDWEKLLKFVAEGREKILGFRKMHEKLEKYICMFLALDFDNLDKFQHMDRPTH